MKKSKIVLVIAVIAAISMIGAAAYIFWTSSTFTTTITIASVLPVYINMMDPAELPDYGLLTLTTDFLPGNLLRFAVDEANNNVQDDLYITITASGEYITAGGTVGATIQRKTINISDIISNLGAPITILDVNLMAPTLLVDIAETGTPGAAYTEITLTNNGGTSWGDYNLDIILTLTDGT